MRLEMLNMRLEKLKQKRWYIPLGLGACFLLWLGYAYVTTPEGDSEPPVTAVAATLPAAPPTPTPAPPQDYGFAAFIAEWEMCYQHLSKDAAMAENYPTVAAIAHNLVAGDRQPVEKALLLDVSAAARDLMVALTSQDCPEAEAHFYQTPGRLGWLLEHSALAEDFFPTPGN